MSLAADGAFAGFREFGRRKNKWDYGSFCRNTLRTLGKGNYARKRKGLELVGTGKKELLGEGGVGAGKGIKWRRDLTWLLKNAFPET